MAQLHLHEHVNVTHKHEHVNITYIHKHVVVTFTLHSDEEHVWL